MDWLSGVPTVHSIFLPFQGPGLSLQMGCTPDVGLAGEDPSEGSAQSLLPHPSSL